MKKVAGWALIGLAAWLGMGVLYAVGSVLTGNTGRPGDEVSTPTALLAAATLAVIAITLARWGRRLIATAAPVRESEAGE